jgi:UDP-N-acetylglucosamine 2-epimerase
MTPYKILTVVGARPQFIKLAPLSKAIAQHPQLTEILVHTGQHYDYAMSQQFFDELEIPPPQYNLEVGSARHVVQMAHIMMRLDAILEKEKPDLVVVFGDTNSTAAAAIAAAKNHIPLAHVEAGLREFNKNTPEEINKILTDSVTDLFFPPTQTGVDNLKKQGITDWVVLTGDIGIDLIVQNLDKINTKKIEIFDKLNQKINTRSSILNAFNSKPTTYNSQFTEGGYFFMTCHRADNTNNVKALEEILSTICELNTLTVFPIHPRTKVTIQQHGLGHFLENECLLIIDPIGFWETQALIKNAKMVLTDSGGVIKEAYFHKVPCVILQNEIEWVEAVEEGWARLAGSKKNDILAAIHNFYPPSVYSGFLGDGQASKSIISAIVRFLSSKKSNR